MTLALVAIGFAFLVVMVLLSRMGRARKKQALQDFEREREAIKPPDILELVAEEVTELDERWAEAAGAIEQIEVPLEKTDISVSHLVLAWMPCD